MPGPRITDCQQESSVAYRKERPPPGDLSDYAPGRRTRRADFERGTDVIEEPVRWASPHHYRWQGKATTTFGPPQRKSHSSRAAEPTVTEAAERAHVPD